MPFTNQLKVFFGLQQAAYLEKYNRKLFTAITKRARPGLAKIISIEWQTLLQGLYLPIIMPIRIIKFLK